YAVKIPSSANSFSIASLKPNSQLLAKEDRLSGQLAGNKHHTDSNKEGQGEGAKATQGGDTRAGHAAGAAAASTPPCQLLLLPLNPGAASASFSIQQEIFPGSARRSKRPERRNGRSSWTNWRAFLSICGGGGGSGSRVIRDRFGMLGLLVLHSAVRGEPRGHQVHRARRGPPMASALPMTQQGDLHPLLASPLSDCCLHKPQYSDHPVPLEYLVGLQVRDRLPPPPLDQLPVETLFGCSNACTCDRLQLCAAKELHKRHWRCTSGLSGAEGERGRYLCWDTDSWSVQARVFRTFTTTRLTTRLPTSATRRYLSWQRRRQRAGDRGARCRTRQRLPLRRRLDCISSSVRGNGKAPLFMQISF
uniref:Uncharacterized protein n=1 Tax=Macrostomum lignano TaxID=282301 RepID=A0A1I8F9L6_9PLAT